MGDVAHTYTDNLQEDSKDKRQEAEECGTVQRHSIDGDEKYLSVKLVSNWTIKKNIKTVLYNSFTFLLYCFYSSFTLIVTMYTVKICKYVILFSNLQARCLSAQQNITNTKIMITVNSSQFSPYLSTPIILFII